DRQPAPAPGAALHRLKRRRPPHAERRRSRGGNACGQGGGRRHSRPAVRPDPLVGRLPLLRLQPDLPVHGDERLMEVLGAWEQFLHERNRVPDLVQCALVHEQFEAIHPFLDGNGRVGRLLITLFLIERGRLSQPLLYLSAYIEQHRREYYDSLQAVRTDGAWKGWLGFFLSGV